MNHYSDSNLLDGTLRLLAGKEDHEIIRLVVIEIFDSFTNELHAWTFDYHAHVTSIAQNIIFSSVVRLLTLRDMLKQPQGNFLWKDSPILRANYIRYQSCMITFTRFDCIPYIADI